MNDQDVHTGGDNDDEVNQSLEINAKRMMMKEPLVYHDSIFTFTVLAPKKKQELGAGKQLENSLKEKDNSVTAVIFSDIRHRTRQTDNDIRHNEGGRRLLRQQLQERRRDERQEVWDNRRFHFMFIRKDWRLFLFPKLHSHHPHKKEEHKRRRPFGKAYIGRCFDKDGEKVAKVNREEKTLGPGCACKALYYSLKSVIDFDRERIHREVWSMSLNEKKVFMKIAIDVKDVKERKSVSDVHKRHNTLVFSLKSEGTRMRVCKNMFLNATGPKKWWVLNTVTEDVPSNHKETQSMSGLG
ncbi:hypothetical protein PoB_007161100 [Plakobranchus ocellatus]|uniref:Uncharacterized protein n=1 Tax=Plakobranchus ocellatus TaxID=259542 RepID=A0AAV4DML7_9GAST|nr:hypothetical protein PoB_007161100 [Plakobranchus ocellatus]